MNKKVLLFTPLLLSIGALSVSHFDAPKIVKAEPVRQVIDYSSDKWMDLSPSSMWSVDEELEFFEFNKNNVHEYNFTSNVMITDQFDIRDATVEMEAVFCGTTTSADIATGPDNDNEVQIGLSPWYVDSNNWILVYCGFKKVKEGHLFDVNCYCKINGSTHVEYFVKDEGNRWIAPSDGSNIEWHSAWPDGYNGNKNPSTLEETEPDPSQEISLYVRKTRKTFAGKDCDSIFLKVNDYELNFGRDNFMFSDPVKKELADPNLMPKVGLYVMNTGYTTVRNLSVSISHDKVLPVPIVEAMTTPTYTGTVGSKVKVPQFYAYDNNGENIDQIDIKILNPKNKEMYLEEGSYFVPNIPGVYKVTASATDSENLTGTYEYVINVKDGKGHIDNDYYNDFLTKVKVDNSITIAKAIFIAVPVLIVLYIGLKIFFTKFRKKKDK